MKCKNCGAELTDEMISQGICFNCAQIIDIDNSEGTGKDPTCADTFVTKEKPVETSELSTRRGIACNSDEQREKERTVTKATANKKQSQTSGCLIAAVIFFGVPFVFGSGFGETSFTFLLIIAVFVGILVAVFNKEQVNDTVAASTTYVETLQQTRRKNMNTMMHTAQDFGFVFSKKVVNMTNTSCLAFDADHHQFLISAEMEDTSYVVLKYEQLVSYELCKDGSSIASGDASGAIVGGLLFGTVGAVAGAAGSTTRIDNYCSELYISIVDNTAKRYRIPLITESIEETSDDYKVAIERARDMLSILDVIEKSNHPIEVPKDLTLPKTTKLSTNDMKNDNGIEAIKKYKELLDMGIITEEEFKKKKTELLGL